MLVLVLQFSMDIWDNSPRIILSLLLSSTARKLCFSEIVERTGLAPGTVTSILQLLRQAEFVLRERERCKPESEFRAPYVWYTLNPSAIHHLRLHAPST
jgi:DNA-binding transcriptional ArsR family regulator